MTSPKIREAEQTLGWFTLVTWLGVVTLVVMLVMKEPVWAAIAFSISTVAVIIAIRAGQEVKDLKIIAETLKDSQAEKIKSLYKK